ncbi:hypothetical protein Tco_0066408 [Tanacetum coccineum]
MILLLNILSDDEASNHEDASDSGTATNKPKQQQQQVTPTTTTISNIKLPILKKEEYDIWAMEMEHYLEYIDNDVWKVIQNGNSKKRISTGKDGVVRILPPVSPAEIHAVEKERKARTILLMAIPKEHLRRFHGMDDAKEIWEAIRTRDKRAGKKEQNQNCLLTMDDGVVNWGEHTVEEEETNHALMAISSNTEVSLCMSFHNKGLARNSMDLQMYALTTNPTIYDSLVKQFWQTATANTLADGTLELHATIDTIVYTITEASIRNKLQLADASGITMLPNNEIFEGMGHMGYPTDGSFTFWKSFFTPQWRFLVHHILHCISSKSGGWDQFGSNIATALICLSTGRVYNFSKLIFDGMVANLKSKTKFLMYPRQEAPSVTQPQPSSSVVPPTPPTTQPIPSEATTIPPFSQPAPPTPIAETTNASPSPTPSPAHDPMEHTFAQPSSDQQPPTPHQEATTS